MYRYASQHSVWLAHHLCVAEFVELHINKRCADDTVLTRISIRYEWQHLYKEVMIKGGSHAENISAYETQSHIGHLTRPFFRIWCMRLGCSVGLYMAPTCLARQTARRESPHDWLVRLGIV